MGEPERQCIACGRRGPRSTFMRLAAVADGGEMRVVVVHGVHSGRGAYLCRRTACLDRALLRKAFQRAFRIPLKVDRDELVAALVDGESVGASQ